MRGSFMVRIGMVVLAGMLAAGVGHAGQVVSTMRNVDAVMSVQGYRLAPAPDRSGLRLPGDLAPTQAFEIIRPNNEAVTIGRLFTSCTCVNLEADKRSYARGERIILTLRNVRPTPAAGQRYAMYVQLTRPIRATLRFDTFVRTGYDEPLIAAVTPEAQRPAAAPSSPATPSSNVPAARRRTPPVAGPSTSSYHPFTVAGGGDGIELIIPRWESDGEEVEDAVAFKELAVPSNVSYSKELTLEEVAAKGVEDSSVESEKAPDEASDEVEEAAGESPSSTQRPKIRKARDNFEEVIDKYAKTYSPDMPTDKEDQAEVETEPVTVTDAGTGDDAGEAEESVE